MNGYYKQVIEVLKANQFKLLRNGKGSHEIWCKENLRVTVPFNCPSRHTANAVFKEAGIAHKI